MTGFGIAVGDYQSRTVKVEIKTLNSRFREFTVHSPHSLFVLEEEVKRKVAMAVNRGRIEIWLQLEESVNSPGRLILNKVKAQRAFDLLAEMRDALFMNDPITLEHLISLNVLTEEEQDSLEDEELAGIKPVILELTERALQEVINFRLKEGAELARDLRHRLGLLQAGIEAVAPLAVKANGALFAKLSSRLAELLQNQLDPVKLAQDVASLTERMDITEEITRFSGHIEAFKRALAETGPKGRSLDFILQELNREVNTMGSKAQLAEISAEVLKIKSELEKMREQVQNIE
jgi:uncharacterized protein (TIGR00255 family)